MDDPATHRLDGPVRAVQLVVLALLVVAAVVIGLTHVLDPPAVPGAAAAGTPYADRVAGQRVEPLVTSSAGACTDHGLRAARTPDADDVVALVRGPRGAVQPVPFARGWQVFRGERPGTLVAVCRAARR